MPEWKYQKHMIAALVVGGVVLLVFFNGCRKKQIEREVTYRPDNFPEVLVAPENAIDVRYSNPEFYEKFAKGRYNLLYHIVEEYPATETIEQIRNDLKMKGCIKVDDVSWTKWRSKTLPDTRWRIKYNWMERWITPGADIVENWLSYEYPEGKEEMNKLFVTRVLHTASSEWGRIKVPHYKETYPELFEVNQDEKTKRDDEIK